MELTPEEIRARRLRKLETGTPGGNRSLAAATATATDGQQDSPVGGEAAAVATSAEGGKTDGLFDRVIGSFVDCSSLRCCGSVNIEQVKTSTQSVSASRYEVEMHHKAKSIMHMYSLRACV